MSWPVLPLGLLGSQASASAAPADNDTYQVSRSLRFNSLDSAYLNRTFPTAGNRKTWTWSGWVKRSSSAYQQIFGSYIGSGTTDTNYFEISFFNDNINVTGYSTTYLRSTAVYRDFSAWYHIVVTTDTTTATADNRIKIYVNGAEITSFSTRNNPTPQSVDLGINAAYGHYLGGVQGNAYYLSAYLTEINFIDGQALTPSSFGETDATTGRWKAKAFTGTYGTNGFYLPFLDNSGATSTTLGKDNSTYRMLTAQLNGTSNGIQRGADLTGIANGKAGTISLWANFTNSAGSYNPLWVSRNNSTIGDSVQLSRQAGGGLRLAALNSAGTGILNVSTAGAACSSSGLYHIYATWDLSVNNRVFIYVNGIDSTGTISTFTNDTIQYSVPNHGLGGNLFSSFVPITPAMLGQVYVNYSTYLDPVTNISKFYSGSSTPVSLGTSGEIPSGSSPIVYLDGDATTILTNRGTGGNFAAYGTLATGTTYQGVGVHYNNWTPNNLSVTPGTGNDSLVDSPTNFGSISTTLVNDTYQISRSLRFNSADSANLTRTLPSSGNLTTWTWSGWVKPAKRDAEEYLFYSGNSSTVGSSITFTASNQLEILYYSSGYVWRFITTQTFRDPTSWYNIVVAYDSGNATQADRVRLFVNGVRITSFSTLTPVATINQVTSVNNSTYPHTIGSPFNGYLAEINFIDGQALNPTSFGTRDINTYLWKPKAYTGTYGTNGFYLPMSFNSSTTYAAFQSDASTNYNTLPHGSQGSTFQFSGNFTIEGWVYYPSSSSGDTSFYVQASGTTYFAFNISMAAGNYNIYLNNSSAPTSSISHGIKANDWTHVAMVRNGSTITLYTNGVSRGTLTNSSTLGFSTINTNEHRFGGGVAGVARYLSNVRITKSAVYTSNFSVPASPLTNIANTLVLTYQNPTAIDNSANAFSIGTLGSVSLSLQTPFNTGFSVGSDTGGSGNNWMPNNFSFLAGPENDSLVDSPTHYGTDNGAGGEARGDYCTLDPLSITGGTFTNGNLRYAGPGDWRRTNSTMNMSAGKWYFEVTLANAPYPGRTASTAYNAFGFSPSNVTNSSIGPGSVTDALVLFDSGFFKNFAGATTDGGTAFLAGDVLSVSVDLDANTFVFRRNNVQITSGTIGGTPGRSLTPCILSYSNEYGVMDVNFGQRPFAYAAPSGFKALRDYNKLPVPTGGEVRGNYAILSPLTPQGSGGYTLSDGGLRIAAGTTTNGASSFSTLGVSSGKWYAEFTYISAAAPGGTTGDVGVIANPTDFNINSGNVVLGTYARGYTYAYSTTIPYKSNNNIYTSYGSAWSVNDVFGVALDLDERTLTFYKNGVSQGVAFTNLPSGYSWFFGCGGSSFVFYANFGQRPWAYDAPFGFLPLCTTLLPQPIVQKSSTAMDVVTYTGTGVSRSITGLGFSPDLVWLKIRQSGSHALFDSTRGATKLLSPNATNVENTWADELTAFNSDGFSLGVSTNTFTNAYGNTYVAWAWDAGSSSVTNTSGAISSTVRANPQAGVSVVSYTGNGTTGSVGHGLGLKPSFIIVKNRSVATANNWGVYHSSLTSSQYIYLNLTNAASTSGASTAWGNNSSTIEPTSSVFTVGNSTAWNGSGNLMIAYCFAEVEGFSKFGSYVGNGSADGPFVYCGFRPRFIIIKDCTNINNWEVLDTTRDTYNITGNYILPNSSQAEGTIGVIDILCNGYKNRFAGGIANTSGANVIFMAFAESPFKYARAR